MDERPEFGYKARETTPDPLERNVTLSPLTDYSARKEEHHAKGMKLEERSTLLANARLLVFVAALGGAWLTWEGALAQLWPVLPLVGLFVLLALIHVVVDERRASEARRVDYYQAGLDRLQHAWIGRGHAGEHYRFVDHVYVKDLDVFGRGSLFERLNTTCTSVGEDTLARWLTEPGHREEVLSRQEAVRELSGEVTLRENLAVACAKEHIEPSRRRLKEWGRRGQDPRSARLGKLALGVTGFGVAAGLGVGLLGASGLFLAAWALGVWALHRYSRGYRGEVLSGVGGIGEDIRSLLLCLEVILEHEVRSTRLLELRQALSRDGASARRILRSLQRCVNLRDAQRNQLFAPLGFFLLWDVFLSVAVERWRTRFGKELVGWLEATGEWDALLALGCYSYENPLGVFPTLLKPEEGVGAVFRGEDLRHPLLPRDQCVPNSVKLGDPASVWMVSGSNMSGKSTLLRTVGCNGILALAGAPVHARALALSPFTLGATLGIHDSLHDGRSRFYAEVQRLGKLLKMAAGERPLLFLIDEIFHGTNSADRSIGAQALISELVERGAVGLLTTHDLALAKAAEAAGERVANVHLRDTVVDGDLIFDYRVHSGILTHTNALHLMRAVGLGV